MEHKQNSLSLKWRRYGFDQSLLDQFPDFAHFLLKTPLGSQIKITNNFPRAGASEPLLCVEGEEVPFSSFRARFTSYSCPHYKETFFIERTSKKIYTYLATGRGFIPHHPYESFFNEPLVKLSRSAHQELLKRAGRFGRKGSYILQIVSYKNKQKKMMKCEHVYLRLIDEEGHVHSLGFGHRQTSRLPYRNNPGHLRTPDIWEYKLSGKKIVTSLLITQEEAERLKEFILSHFAEGGRPTFNLFAQNCALFVRKALQYACRITIPCNLSLFPKAIEKAIKRWERALSNFEPYVIKPFFKILRELVQSSIEVSCSVILSLVGLALGAGCGVRGRGISHPNFRKEIDPPARSLDWWFDLRHKEFDFPHLVLRWQRKQASTLSFENYSRLAI